MKIGCLGAQDQNEKAFNRDRQLPGGPRIVSYRNVDPGVFPGFRLVGVDPESFHSCI